MEDKTIKKILEVTPGDKLLAELANFYDSKLSPRQK